MDESPVDPAWLKLLPLPMGVVRAGLITFGNQAYLDLVGRSLDQVTGRTYDAFLVPEDLERIQERHALRKRGEQVPATYEATVVRPSGERRVVEVFVRSLGEVTLVQMHDVTERGVRQAHLRALARLGNQLQGEPTDAGIFEMLGAGLLELGVGLLRLEPAADGVRLRQAFLRPPLLAKLEARLGAEALRQKRPWTAALTQAWADGFGYDDDLPLALFHQFGATDGPIVREELASTGLQRGVLLRLDVQAQKLGLLRLLTSWAEPENLPALALFGAQVSAALEAARMMEDLRDSYAALNAAQAQLASQEQLAAIGEMAAAVAHEVRNPLGVIFNWVGFLRRELAPGPATRSLQALTEEAERINHIVGDLLDFARPTKPVFTTSVGLQSLVEEAVASATEVAGPLHVELHSLDELGGVAMDVRLMRQVFVNLAANAAQAMPRGGLLRITLRREVRSGVPWAAVELSDTGPGIPPANLARIFQPFFTTRAQGTGLGLALVKRILEGHRGEVEVRSNPGEGAVFTVRWPAA